MLIPVMVHSVKFVIECNRWVVNLACCYANKQYYCAEGLDHSIYLTLEFYVIFLCLTFYKSTQKYSCIINSFSDSYTLQHLLQQLC